MTSQRLQKEPKQISIIVADDMPIEMAGLRDFIRRNTVFRIVSECLRYEEIASKVIYYKPRLLILALQASLQQINELNFSIKTNSPLTRIILLSSNFRRAKLSDLTNIGISGLADRRITEKNFEGILNRVASGETALSQIQFELACYPMLASDKFRNLTDRESQILYLLSKGYDNKRISSYLGISLKTTAFHVSNILAKLNVSSRLEAVIWAKENFCDLQDRIIEDNT